MQFGDIFSFTVTENSGVSRRGIVQRFTLLQASALDKDMHMSLFLKLVRSGLLFIKKVSSVKKGFKKCSLVCQGKPARKRIAQSH